MRRGPRPYIHHHNGKPSFTTVHVFTSGYKYSDVRSPANPYIVSFWRVLEGKQQKNVSLQLPFLLFGIFWRTIGLLPCSTSTLVNSRVVFGLRKTYSFSLTNYKYPLTHQSIIPNRCVLLCYYILSGFFNNNYTLTQRSITSQKLL